jgi:cytochrome c peroxidase
MRKALTAVTGAMLVTVGGCGGTEDGGGTPEVSQTALLSAVNSAGFAETVHTSGAIDRSNPFFQPLGTNPRTCETCHSSAQGWTLTSSAATVSFLQSQGLAPLFELQDAGSRPDADISTLDARRATFGSTTVQRGLIRFNRTINNNPNAEFTVTEVVDPSGFSDLTHVLSFRRPTPTANQSKVPSTGWNGVPNPDVRGAVTSTSSGASRLHEQRADAPDAATLAAMADFQLGVVFAQARDFRAGRLDAGGARGGAANLLAQPFYVGINDIQGNDPMGQPFTRKVFDLYDAWAPGMDGDGGNGGDGDVRDARAAIFRGQEMFNNLEFDITGVSGLNDLLGQETVRGTCSTCHNAPNVGSHSVVRFFDVGTADQPNCGSQLPLVTVQNKATGETRKICDFGRGLGTGKWSDLGAFRAPPLRGLAARAPYFHDGQAKDIRRVINYFNGRFQIHLNDDQKRDLEAFLKAL